MIPISNNNPSRIPKIRKSFLLLFLLGYATVIGYVAALPTPNETPAFDTSPKHLSKRYISSGSSGNGHVSKGAVVAMAIIITTVVLLGLCCCCAKQRAKERYGNRVASHHVNAHPGLSKQQRPTYLSPLPNHLGGRTRRPINAESELVQLPPSAHPHDGHLPIERIEDVRRAQSSPVAEDDLNEAPPPAYFEIFGRDGRRSGEDGDRLVSRT